MKLKLLILVNCMLFLKSYAIKPDSVYIATPKNSGIAYDSVTIKTSDNYSLVCWILKSAHFPMDPIIIYSGTDAGNMSYSLPFAGYIVKNLDVTFCLFDYRGFGKSQKYPITKDTLTYPAFLKDINAVTDFVNRIKADSTEVYLMGTSMGASLSICVASRRNDIEGVFADDPYITQQSIVNSINHIKPANQQLGYFKDEALEPMDLVKYYNRPKLAILHSLRDKHISTDEVYKYYDLVKSKRKDLFIFGNSGHGEIMSKDFNAFLSELQGFIFQ